MRKLSCLLLCVLAALSLVGQSITGTTYFCPGYATTLSVSNAPANATIKWQRSSDNGATWTDLQNSTVLTYTTSLAGLFRAEVATTKDTVKTPAVTVIEAPVPTASFTASPSSQCGTVPVHFANTSTGTGLTYSWNFDDPESGNNSSTQKDPVHRFVGNPGNGYQTFTAGLTVTNSYGCTASTTGVVRTQQLPDTKLSGPGAAVYEGKNYFRSCNNAATSQFNFSNPSSTSATNTSYRFVWGDKTPDYTAATFDGLVQHNYTTGTYTMHYIVRGQNGCFDTATYYIFVGSNPAVGLGNPGNTTVCTGSNLTFPISNTSSNPPGTIYTVTFNDNTPPVHYNHPAPTSVTHLFQKTSCGTNSGTYSNSFSATIEAKNPCQTSSATVVPIYVSDRPKADFTVSPGDSVCVNTTVTLNNISGLTSYVDNGQCYNGKAIWSISPATGWTASGALGNDFGTTDPSLWSPGDNNLPIRFTATGIYTIKLRTANPNCGEDEVTKTICVNPAPTGSFALDKTLGCGPLNVNVSSSTNSLTCGKNRFSWAVTYSPLSGCVPSTSAYTYLNGTNANSAQPSFQFTNPGVYTISLTLYGPGNACSVPIPSQQVTVKSKPSLSFVIPATTCQNQTIKPTATATCFMSGNPAPTYEWAASGGTVSSPKTLDPVSVVFANVGTQTLSLSATNECGNTSLSQNIAVNPTPDIDGTKDIVACAGATVGPLLFSSSVSGTIIKWTNDNPDVGLPVNGNGASVGAFTASNSTGNPLKATITVIATKNSCSSTQSFIITVNPKPAKPAAPDKTYCQNEIAAPLTATASPGHTLLWYNQAAGGTGATTAPKPVTTTTGTFYYYVSQVNTATGCEGDRPMVSVVINETPNITKATGKNPASCNAPSGSIVLEGLAANRDFTVSFTADGVVKTNTYRTTAAGTLTIPDLRSGIYENITVARSGCTSAPAGPISLSDPEAPAIPATGLPVTLCSGQTLNLTASSATAGVYYTWSGPAGYHSNEQNPSLPNITVNKAGIYSVTATRNGCTSGAGTVAVTVNQTPVTPTITASNTVCSGTTISLHATTSPIGATFSWTGPGGFKTEQAAFSIPDAPVAASGVYSVTATLGACSSASTSATVTVNPTPTITATGTDPATCNAATGFITIAGLTAGRLYTYSYTVGNTVKTGTGIAMANGTLLLEKLVAGTYDKIQVTLDNCPGNVVGPIRLSDPTPPVAPVATANGPLCEGETLRLTANTTTTGNLTWAWTGPNAFGNSQQNPSRTNLTTADAGVYRVTVTKDGCQSAEATVNLVVNARPKQPTVGSNEPVCTGADLALTATTSFTGAVTWLWNGPHGYTSTEQNPVIRNAAVTDGGSYSVQLTATTGACPAPLASATVSIHPTPVIGEAIARNPTRCSTGTGSIELKGLLPGKTHAVTYTKDGAPETTDITADASGVITIAGLFSGVYDKINVTLSGCTSNTVGPFMLSNPNPPLTPVVTADKAICSGKTLTLGAQTATQGDVTYSWTGPNGFKREERSPSITNISTAYTGIYRVTATLNGCTSAAASAEVVVNPTPEPPVAGSNSPVCAGGTINLQASTTFAGVVSYSWTGPNSFANALANPAIAGATAAMAGEYRVEITSAAGGCTSAPAITTVSVNPTPVLTGGSSTDPTSCNSASGSITLKGLAASRTYTVTYTYGNDDQVATVAADASGNLTIPNLRAGLYSNVRVSLLNCPSNVVGPFRLADPNPPATPVVSTNSALCSGGTLQLLATTTTTGQLSWFWKGPNGFTSKEQNPALTGVSLANAGLYTVTVTLNNCESEAGEATVVINQTPDAPKVTGTSPVCAGGTINLTATAPGTVTYTWTGPAGLISHQQNPVIQNATTAASGTYTVTATSAQGSCVSAPAGVAVLVHPGLVNKIDTALKVLCFSQQVTVRDVEAGGGTGAFSFQWEHSADGINWTAMPGQTGVSLTFTPAASVYVRRRVESSPCFSASLPAFIAVQPPVTNNSVKQAQEICINTKASLLVGSDPIGANGNYFYQWENSTDGGRTWHPITGATARDYEPGVLTQTTHYRRLVTTDLCNGPQRNTSEATVITVRPDARALLQPTVTLACPPFHLTDAVVNLQNFPAQNSRYDWFANGVFLGSGTNFPGYIIRDEDDTVTILLKAVSRYGCKNDSVPQRFSTYKLPHPSFELSDTANCGPLSVVVRNTTPNTSLFTYQWDFGNGKTSTQAEPGTVIFLPNPTHADTVYTVKLKVFSTCDTLVVTKSVRVKSPPKALFTPVKTTGCSPMKVVFRNTSKGDHNTYYWDFGDGHTYSTTLLDSVVHTFNTGRVETFYVQLKAVNECGSDSIRYAIVVSPNTIKLNFAVNGPENFGCTPHTVAFINNTSGASTFQWDFGDGNFRSTTKNVDTVYHTYQTAGAYRVNLRAFNTCSDTTTTTVITVYPKPKAAFTISNNTLCIGDTLRFTNLSDSATSYLWQFGDGNTSTRVNPTYRYARAGLYTVTLVIFRNNPSGNVCADTTSQQVQVAATLQGFFTASDTVGQCAPFRVTFVNRNRPSVTTTWDFGDGNTGSGDSLVHTYAAFGTYPVKLTVTVPGGCSYVSGKTVTVLGPGGTLNYTGGYNCSPNAVQLQAVAQNTDSYEWDFGDGTTLTTTQPVIYHNYQHPGAYLPSVKLVNKAGCVFPLRGIDTIKVDKVTAGFTTAQQVQCGVTAISFADTSRAFFGKAQVKWSFGDNTFGTGSSPTHAYTASGTYPVQMIVLSNSGCSDTVQKQVAVQVNSKPVATINAVAAGCTGSAITFRSSIQSTDAISITKWSVSNGASGEGPVFAYDFAQPGTYTVQLVAGTVNGCYDTTRHTLQISQSPVVKAGAGGNLCLGNAMPLSASGAETYQWMPLRGLNCYTCSDPIASPTITTPYVVEGRNSFGCVDYDTVVVTVIQPLKMVVSANDSICIGQSANLLVRGGTAYNWSPAEGLNSTTLSNPTASPRVTTTYRVVGYDGFNCFTDTAFVTVAVGNYPTVELGPDLTLAAGTQHQLVSTITNGPIRNWAWTPATNLSCSNCAVPVADIKKDMTYSVKVTSSYGCSASDTVSIKVFCESSQVFIPNAFTPDGDGINDILMVRSKGVVTVRFFRIFNRWGTLVFEKSNFGPNNPLYAWDGKVNGVVGGPDVYVYTCEVLCENGSSFTYKGNVSIIK